METYPREWAVDVRRLLDGCLGEGRDWIAGKSTLRAAQLPGNWPGYLQPSKSTAILEGEPGEPWRQPAELMEKSGATVEMKVDRGGGIIQ